MPSTRKRSRDQQASRGRPSKRRHATSKQTNETSNETTVVEHNSVNIIDSASIDPAPFTDLQLGVLKTLIKDSVSESSREIAAEAARAAVNALQAVPSASPPSVPSNQPLPAENIVSNNYQASPSLPSAVPNVDIPSSYVKEIHTGEFFDLSKLLPKNLTVYDDDDHLSLTLENSTVKVSKKKSTSSRITDIEQWTTAFTSYMSVFTCKYPLRAQEFLQYLSMIRYAARIHKGLGWAIYDHKFRQKAGLDKTLVWSQLDQHLWLTIFTVSPSALNEEYPLFNNGPPRNVSKGGLTGGICHQFNRVGECSREHCEYQHICNRCRGKHSGRDCTRANNARGEGHRTDEESRRHSKSSGNSSGRHKQ